MRDIDFEYVAEDISSISGIVVRIYKDSKIFILSDPFNFPVDPAAPYINSMLQIESPISYYVSPYDQFYGIIHADNYAIILGPTFEVVPSREKTREFIFALNVKLSQFQLYQTLLESIVPTPLEHFLRELCLLNYSLTGVRLNVSDAAVFDHSHSITRQESLSRSSEELSEDEVFVSDESTTVPAAPQQSDHSGLEWEDFLMDCIRLGDLNGLDNMIRNVTPTGTGKKAFNYLRQLKNAFIMHTTLASRAAVRGGMPADEAIQLSDQYILHAESFNDAGQILNLQYNMLIDFTTIVNDIRSGKRYDRFMRSVTKYIQDNITKEINTGEMAVDLGLSRSHLSTKFKSETGISLSDYIQQQRIEKAKELLRMTSRSIQEISSYLNYSSQGYFQNVFKKVTGMTPKSYRQQ